MAKTALEKELERLQDELIDLGVMVERTIIESVEILKTQQIEGACHLIAADSEINRRRYSIESDALVLIARQQPMAKTCGPLRPSWKLPPSWRGSPIIRRGSQRLQFNSVQNL